MMGMGFVGVSQTLKINQLQILSEGFSLSLCAWKSVSACQDLPAAESGLKTPLANRPYTVHSPWFAARFPARNHAGKQPAITTCPLRRFCWGELTTTLTPLLNLVGHDPRLA
ncbi:predicted protein [Histoplasma capsulatum H143]|uniref:Uncharacterized protein n=1 Tax=Ajellomyces capsulatus (strain H143) TaxID=544712 RepID=C6HK33_AJECH|nr:predicted protein [Histoplasma capsulatum H143]